MTAMGHRETKRKSMRWLFTACSQPPPFCAVVRLGHVAKSLRTSRRFLGAAVFAALHCQRVHFLHLWSIVHPACMYVHAQRCDVISSNLLHTGYFADFIHFGANREITSAGSTHMHITSIDVLTTVNSSVVVLLLLQFLHCHLAISIRLSHTSVQLKQE